MSGFLFFWRNWSRSGWFRGWHHGRSGRSITIRGATARGATAVAGGRATFVAAALDHFVATQAESLLGLTNHTSVAITQRTGQGGDDFGAAAAILANLIANLICCGTTNSFISIVQAIDESRHDLWIADAVISVTELAERGTSLAGIAGRLRSVDQLGDITRIRVAAFGFANRRAGCRTCGRSATCRST